VGIITWKSDDGNYVPFDITGNVDHGWSHVFFHFDVSKDAIKKPIWNKGVYFKGRFASCSNVHKHEPFQKMRLTM